MGGSTPRGPPPDAVIHEISIEEEGVPRTLEAPPASRPWVVAVVIAATIGGLGYGFLLGRGDRPEPPVATAAGTTTTMPSGTTPASTSVTTLNPFPQREMAFVRANPGHDLGRGVTEYLDPNQHRALAIDDHGIVWAGGANGVMRLDPDAGEFTMLTGPDGTGPLDITALAAAPDGTVFAASEAGLSRWDGEAWTHDSRFPHSYPDERWVRHLEVGPSGEVWLATNWWEPGAESSGYLHRLEPPYVGDMPAFTMEFEMGAMAVADDGTLYLHSGARLWRYDGAWHDVARVPNSWYQTMAVDETGDVWFAGEGRVYRWDGSDVTLVPWEASPPDDHPESGWGVNALAPGRVGGMWALAHSWGPGVETEAWALVHFDGAGQTMTTIPPMIWPRALAVAPDGAVWVAGGRELLRVADGVEAFSMEVEVPLVSSRTLAAGADGEVWAAGEEGLLRLNGDEWRLFGRDDLGLEPNEQADGFWVASGPDGSIWAGVGCRAFQLAGDEWMPLPEPDGGPACDHATVAVDPAGALLMNPGYYNVYASSVYRWSGEAWDLIVSARDQPDIAFGTDDEIWMVHEYGISRLVDGEPRPVLEGVDVSEVAVSVDGDVWATVGRWDERGGLWHYDEQTWSLVRKGITVHSLTRGPHGKVWGLLARDDGGTGLIDLESGHTRFVAETDLWGPVAVAPDGVVWIGGGSRLYRMTPLYDLALTSVDWGIELDNWGPGIHTVTMLADPGPLVPGQVAATYGHLVWAETLVELCSIGVDYEDAEVTVGDIFQTSEGCGSNPTAMQEAFDQFGLPVDACVFVDVDGLYRPLSYCARLAVSGPTTP